MFSPNQPYFYANLVLYVDIGLVNSPFDQFVSVFTKDVGRDLPDVSNRVENDIPQLSIGEEGVFKLLHNIKVDKAAGPDESPTEFYKNVHLKLPQQLQQFSRSRWTPANCQKTGEMQMLHQCTRKAIVIHRKTTAQYPSPVYYQSDLSTSSATTCSII